MPQAVIGQNQECLASVGRFLIDRTIYTATQVIPSAEESGFEAVNAYDDLEDTQWSAGAVAGISTLDFEFANPITVNSFCYARSNLADTLGTINLQWSADIAGPWTDWNPAEIPSGEGPRYVTGAPQTAKAWRVLINSPSQFFLGLMSFGEDIALPLPVHDGVTPPPYNHQVITQAAGNQNGGNRGSTLIRKNTRVQWSNEWIPADFAYGDWDRIVQHFWVYKGWHLWSSTNHPDEASFCWSDSSGGGAKPAVNSQHGLTTISVDLLALAS